MNTKLMEKGEPMSYTTIEVPTERTDLDEEVAMFLIQAALTAGGRNKHLAGLAVMRELVRQFPAADIVEIGAEWEKRVKVALASIQIETKEAQ